MLLILRLSGSILHLPAGLPSQLSRRFGECLPTSHWDSHETQSAASELLSTSLILTESVYLRTEVSATCWKLDTPRPRPVGELRHPLSIVLLLSVVQIHHRMHRLTISASPSDPRICYRKYYLRRQYPKIFLRAPRRPPPEIYQKP
jgi:hypothetical protein